MNLKKTTELYLLYLEEKGRHKRTLYTYSKDLEQIRNFFGDHKKLKSITVTQVLQFLESDELLMLPKGKRRAERTIIKTIRVMRMLFFWAYEEGLLEEVPLPQEVPLGKNAA